MKDIHSHILYGIDDGSGSYEKSISLLENMKLQGITDIVCTPHYIVGSNYNYDNKYKRNLINQLAKKTNINLYMGNEIFIDKDIDNYIKKEKISTINNSRYILIEFPLFNKLNNIDDILDDLIKKKYIPIIAHPERYEYLDINYFNKLILKGCILQGNITSLSKKYGRNVKKRLKELLNNNMIHVMGTDTHCNIYDINKLIKKLNKLIDEETFINITEKNFDKIINNENIV